MESNFRNSLAPPDPNHQFGAIYREPDPRDWHLERVPEIAAQLAAGVPPSFMSIPIDDVKVIYSQNGPSCVANSICGAKSIEDFQDLGLWQRYDADQLYKVCGGDGINGIYADTALRYVQGTGCLEIGTDRRFTIDSYFFAPQNQNQWRETLTAALVASGPCVVATLVPTVFGWDSGDVMSAGYHQMCLIGYTGLGDGDYAVFLNSWGLWGNKGFCRLRWAYLEANSFQSNHVYGYRMLDHDDPNPLPPDPPTPEPDPAARPEITNVKAKGSRKTRVIGVFDPGATLSVNGRLSEAGVDGDRFTLRKLNAGRYEFVVTNPNGLSSPPWVYNVV